MGRMGLTGLTGLMGCMGLIGRTDYARIPLFLHCALHFERLSQKGSIPQAFREELLYGTTKQNISQHIDGIYKDGELVQGSTNKKFLLVRTEGSRQARRNMTMQNWIDAPQKLKPNAKPVGAMPKVAVFEEVFEEAFEEPLEAP